MPATPTVQELAKECSALMDSVESDGYHGSTSDTTVDPRMTRIQEIVTILESFAPELLDPRFTYEN